MTKYNIRLRRTSLTQGQIERHKDFRSLRGMSVADSSPNSFVKIVAVILGVMIIGGMMYLGYSKLTKEKPKVEEHVPDIYDEFKY